MAYIVADPCVKCKYTDCVAVCPVDCFYEGKNMLVIHPDECIDCGACEPECPTTAIFEESELKGEWEVYKEINAVFSGHTDPSDATFEGWPEALKAGAEVHFPWPVITDQKEGLPGAEEAETEPNKLDQLSPERGG